MTATAGQAGVDPHAALAALADRIRAARASATRLRIRAGGSKDFYGNAVDGEILDPRPYAGIVDYEPSELVITARCGTPLAELEAALAREGQMLAFEPPHFGAATLGGCVAAGLAGPRRATAGGVRDFVLGARVLDGNGTVLSFGGTVMKNVAGFDVARLLAGSLGTLGVIVEASLKVLPRPAVEQTLCFQLDQEAALKQINAWAGKPLPISASAWHGGTLSVRLSGAPAALQAARRTLGGEALDDARADAFWRALREQTDPFFAGAGPLWRLSLPSTAAPLRLAGEPLIEWHGAQRWSRTDEPAAVLRERAREAGGHATLFRARDPHRRQVDGGAFTPLAAPIAAIHRRLKTQFDPARIFNPGRLYPDF
jgi:glycolate oxidase FAD binding subunit